jgi:hypothetical protein
MLRLRKYNFILFLFLIFSSISGFSQKQFPAEYEGVWKGELSIYAGTRVVQKAKMQLTIQSTDVDSVYTYQLQYGEGNGADIRDYQLNILDQDKGMFEIDEKNSIVLPAQLFHNKVVSTFIVEGNMIQFVYNLFEDRIQVEVFSGPHEAATFTGTELESPKVGLLKTNIYQVCDLRKVD